MAGAARRPTIAAGQPDLELVEPVLGVRPFLENLDERHDGRHGLNPSPLRRLPHSSTYPWQASVTGRDPMHSYSSPIEVKSRSTPIFLRALRGSAIGPWHPSSPLRCVRDGLQRLRSAGPLPWAGGLAAAAPRKRVVGSRRPLWAPPLRAAVRPRGRRSAELSRASRTLCGRELGR
jgi:hypothetical protein